jgi:hypothetical protein
MLLLTLTLPMSLPATNLLYDLPILDSWYKWGCTICDLLCLASFTLHDLRLIHIVAYTSTSFHFRANSIHRMYVSQFTYWFSCWWTVGLFHLWDIVNSTLWTCIYKPRFSVCLGLCFLLLWPFFHLARSRTQS